MNLVPRREDINQLQPKKHLLCLKSEEWTVTLLKTAVAAQVVMKVQVQENVKIGPWVLGSIGKSSGFHGSEIHWISWS